MENNNPVSPEEECCQNGCHNCVLNKGSVTFNKWEYGRFCRDKYRYDLLSQTCFKPFILMKVEPITLNTCLYVMKPYLNTSETLHGFLPYTAGQHLSLCIDPKDVINGSPSNCSCLIRSFTLVSLSSEHDDCSFHLLIKLYENSATSNFLRSLKVGNITYWKGPFGAYQYQSNSYSYLIMICMGTGIAPMYPIIKEILSDENDETNIKLLYGCKRSSEIILRNELQELNSYWNFKCTYYFSEEDNINNKKYNEEFILSRISVKHLSSVITNKSSFFLICGSSKFSDDIMQCLKKLNIDENMTYVF